MARFRRRNSAQLGNSGGWRIAGGSTRSLLKTGFAAGFAALIVFGEISLAAAQQESETAELIKKRDELQKAGKYSEAIPLAQQVLAIREAQLGPDHPLVAAALNALAILYYNQHRCAEAELLYQRVLAIREKTLGPDDPAVAQRRSAARSLGGGHLSRASAIAPDTTRRRKHVLPGDRRG